MEGGKVMRLSNIKMTTRVKREDLLATVRNNFRQHEIMVKEAQDGYRQKAIMALQEKVSQLREGKNISLVFSLKPPDDYSEVYKNCISMLEWNTAEYVELEPDEFRQLVRDEWDWSEGFITSNAWLSETVGGALVARGYRN